MPLESSKSFEKIKKCPYCAGEIKEADKGVCFGLSCKHYNEQVVEVEEKKENIGKLSQEDTLEIIQSISEIMATDINYFMTDIKNAFKKYGGLTLTAETKSINSLTREQKNMIVEDLVNSVNHLTRDMSSKDIEFFLSEIKNKLSDPVKDNIFSLVEEKIFKKFISLVEEPKEKMEKIVADVIFKINKVVFLAEKDSSGKAYDEKNRDKIISEEVLKIINTATSNWAPYNIKKFLDELNKSEIFFPPRTKAQETAINIVKKISEETLNYLKKMGVL